jgi:hypothetical protein
MAEKWAIESREPEPRIVANGTAIEDGTSWVLRCPKGHRIRCHTNFFGHGASLGCEACVQPYLFEVPSS